MSDTEIQCKGCLIGGLQHRAYINCKGRTFCNNTCMGRYLYSLLSDRDKKQSKDGEVRRYWKGKE